MWVFSLYYTGFHLRVLILLWGGYLPDRSTFGVIGGEMGITGVARLHLEFMSLDGNNGPIFLLQSRSYSQNNICSYVLEWRNSRKGGAIVIHLCTYISFCCRDESIKNMWECNFYICTCKHVLFLFAATKIDFPEVGTTSMNGKKLILYWW